MPCSPICEYKCPLCGDGRLTLCLPYEQMPQNGLE